MKKAAVLFLLYTMIGSAGAMFVELSEAELIKQSGMIVVGELIGRAVVGGAEKQDAKVLGVIRVEETLKGDTGAAIVFLALPGHKFMHSAQLTHNDGQRGLWYLRLQNADEAGIYVADHPQRFVPLDNASAQIEALRSLQR